MNTNAIPQRYLAAAVIIIGLYGSIRSVIRYFGFRYSMSFLTANVILFLLFALSMAICVIGARSPKYRIRWVAFGVASLLGLVLFSSANAVGALIAMGRITIW